MPFATSNKLYTVRRDGKRKVLHARYRAKAITIGRTLKGWDLERYPYLSWEWKAVKLPVSANERSLSSNDSAASVYVVWDIGFPFYVDGIRYAWSTSQPVGTRIWRRFGHDQILIQEQGVRYRNRWRKIRVDVRRHHNDFFERERLRSPSGIALLTDADATGSAAEAYYANFRLCREIRR